MSSPPWILASDICLGLDSCLPDLGLDPEDNPHGWDRRQQVELGDRGLPDPEPGPVHHGPLVLLGVCLLIPGSSQGREEDKANTRLFVNSTYLIYFVCICALN